MMLPESGFLPGVARCVQIVLASSLLLTLIRLVRGPSLPDRVLALDLIATIALAMMAAHAIQMRELAILDAGIVAALIGFLGSVAFASYLERGGGH